MSADNGVFIAKFPDGYRVTYAMCIDNIDYYAEGTKERKRELKKYFGGCPVFQAKESAWLEAVRIYEDFDDYMEYGMMYIGEYESFDG